MSLSGSGPKGFLFVSSLNVLASIERLPDCISGGGARRTALKRTDAAKGD